ncbi:MAG TPA: hypothetical protein VIP11_02720 [Gemmatimonadaceae bacterium]
MLHTNARARRLLCAIPIALLLVGCQDDVVSNPSINPSTSKASRSASPSEAAIVEPKTSERFSIALDASGSFRPGVPIVLHVAATAHFASPNTVLRVMVPELQTALALKSGNVEPVEAWSSNLNEGQTEHRTVKLLLPKAGVYHVFVDARFDGMNPLGARIQNVGGESLELDISERGVRARPSTKPVGFGVTTLLACVEGDIECCLEHPEQPSCSGPGGGGGSDAILVTGRIRYTQPGVVNYVPIRRARISYAGAGITSGVTNTDENGAFSVPCSPSNAGQTTVRVDLDNSDITVAETMAYFVQPTSMGSGCTPPDIGVAGWPEAIVWDNMLRTTDGSRAYFQFSRPRLEVDVTTRFGNGSEYRRTSDFVVIDPADVNGAWGVFAASHEYGHAVQAHLPNGIANFSCGGAHGFLAPNGSAACSYFEGFATYHSVAALPNGNQEAVPAESDAYRINCTPIVICEGRVAAALLDLTDPVNASDPDGTSDDVALPARQVLDAIGSCALSYAFRLPFGGEIVSSYWDAPYDLSALRKCIAKDHPKFIGPVNGNEWWWMNTTTPWPALTATVKTAVDARLARP